MVSMTGGRFTGVAILAYITLVWAFARTPSAQPQQVNGAGESGFVGAAGLRLLPPADP